MADISFFFCSVRSEWSPPHRAVGANVSGDENEVFLVKGRIFNDLMFL